MIHNEIEQKNKGLCFRVLEQRRPENFQAGSEKAQDQVRGSVMDERAGYEGSSTERWKAIRKMKTPRHDSEHDEK